MQLKSCVEISTKVAFMHKNNNNNNNKFSKFSKFSGNCRIIPYKAVMGTSWILYYST